MCSLTRPLMHLHFSKTGGSALCRSVVENGCRTAGHNCGVRHLLQDRPWWIPYDEHAERPSNSAWHLANFAYPPAGKKNRTCERRRHMRVQFLEIESPLPSLCADFDYSAIFRSPIASFGNGPMGYCQARSVLQLLVPTPRLPCLVRQLLYQNAAGRRGVSDVAKLHHD